MLSGEKYGRAGKYIIKPVAPPLPSCRQVRKHCFCRLTLFLEHNA